MYKTSIETEVSGPFGGGMVVSMRPMSPSDAIRASAITARFPHTHGMPVHMGNPLDIGITDIDKPDWGTQQSFTKVRYPCSGLVESHHRTQFRTPGYLL